MSRRASIAGLLAAALMAVVAPAASAANFTVNAAGDHVFDGCDPAPGDCTVRDAITAANVPGGADTITIPAGTYTMDTGYPQITDTVTISGPATAQPSATIDAFGKRVFDVAAAASPVTISHLAITRASTPDITGGSAVLQRGGTVTLDHNILEANSNNLTGGAILLQSGTLNITDTEVRESHGHQGGGLYIAAGTAIIDRTLWLANDGSTGGGGAIYNAGGSLTVTNSTFAANSSGSGRGGAVFAAAFTVLRNVTFEANTAAGSGGGGSALWANTSPTISNVLFGNSAYQDNCGGSAPMDSGGSIDTGSSCGLGPAASDKTVLLGPLALNGGSARSLLPWSGSTGLNTGDNSQCTATDQRSAPRPHSPGDPCDVGAVEGSAGTPPPPPLLETLGQSSTEGSSTLLDATIDRRGVATTYVVEYGLTSAYGSTSWEGLVPFGTGVGPQDAAMYLEQLEPGTTYHYRFVATSAGGTVTGPDRTFRTVGSPLTTTQPATGISTTGATLNGTVNPSGVATAYWFEYGPTTDYGSKTAVTSAENGFDDLAVEAVLTGLEPGTTVHFRLAAINESGDTGVGDDRSFTTSTPTVLPQPTPTATPQPTPTPTPTPPPTPPTPRFQDTVVVVPVSGTVLVRRPGSKDFVALDASQGIPVGSTVDTKRGVVELTTISKSGKRETARFFDGIFRITQTATTTDLTLTEPLAPCKRAGARSSAAKPKSRRLWGDGKGKFRTKGSYSAATVRGTKWLTQDTCAGTLTRVTQGIVAVRHRNKTIILRAGKRYLARAPR